MMHMHLGQQQHDNDAHAVNSTKASLEKAISMAVYADNHNGQKNRAEMLVLCVPYR